MSTKLHYFTFALLAVGALIRVAVWQPAPTIPADDRIFICAIVYAVLLSSYAILAAVAWFARRFQRFSAVVCAGGAANVGFGIACDYRHSLYSDRSWYGGLDILDAIGQSIVVCGGLLLVAFLYGLFSMLHKGA